MTFSNQHIRLNQSLCKEFIGWDTVRISSEYKRCLEVEYAAAAAATKSLQSCPTLCDPIDKQPSRLPHPWDSPGKNTGVGCHFLLQCMN